MLKFFIFALFSEIYTDPISNPCPSDCWELKDGACALKTVTDPNAVCFAINCAHDRMTIDFDSKLFDIEDDDQTSPFGTPGPCTPIWDSDANKWQWASALGECGMIVGTNVDTHNYVTFDVGFAVAGKKAVIDTTEIHLSGVGSGFVTVQFQCRYRADVTTDTVPFNVHMAVADQKAFSDGSFKNGFSITLFQDASWSTPVDELTKVYIGSTLFIQAEWSVTSLKSKIHFYVESCMVNHGAFEVAIIKNNCYSTAVEASLASSQHVVHNRARFTYKTFSIGQTMTASVKITCTLRLCVLGDLNSCVLNTQDDQCPDKNSGFAYTIKGSPQTL